MDRPFFSIIIPCYNSKPERIKELLDSIYDAGCNDITELIITDDRSTDKSYLDVVTEYSDKFFIRIYSIPTMNEDGTIPVHCPGNTREYGVQFATGEWITFVDHDDLLVKNTLTNIKRAIDDTGEKYLIYSNFTIIDMDNGMSAELKITEDKNWMHGKFYNLDNFWKANNFHFKKDLVSHEDVYITNKTFCLLNRKKDSNFLLYDESTYIWRLWNDNTTNARSVNRTKFIKYIHDFLPDYITASTDVYIDDYNELLESGNLKEENINFHRDLQADNLVFLYFYIQGLKYNYKQDFKYEYEALVKRYIWEYYERFNMSGEGLYTYIVSDNSGRWFNIDRDLILKFISYFVETDSFRDFLVKI